jgi:type I restriction enzyme R subunit
MVSRTSQSNEEYDSKIPALKVLANLGWQYLTPAQCLLMRGSNREVILREVLVEVLQARHFDYKGQTKRLSSNAIEQIITKLASGNAHEGLKTANQRLYDDLSLGITVSEFVEGGKKHQPTIAIIDWDNPTHNRFHFTEEFNVANAVGTNSRQPDIVCFVNGLPLVVIEAKKAATNHPGKSPTAEAISQMIGNQGGQEIPQLFVYSQLLLAISSTQADYATTNTQAKFWTGWQEEILPNDFFTRIKNLPLTAQTHQAIFERRPAKMAEHFVQQWSEPQLVTAQDQLLISLLSKARLLEMIRFYLLFDKKVGKVVARYPQFFAIKAMLERLTKRQTNGAREGGVIWHTTGSGKSFTMVLLCKVLLLQPELKNCRIVVITDRVDLEKQLANTFLSSGAFGTAIAGKKQGDKLAKVATGKQLAKRIGQGNERILFSIINKFNTAAKQAECFNPSDDIIVLVDEGHRSQDGENHQRMRQVLPRAAFIAFTGTPLLKKDKTRKKFGSLIHSYTMDDATKDGIVTPLLYEERQPELDINKQAIDNWFDKITASLNPQQKADLKQKYSRKGEIYLATNRIELIAWDIAIHFEQHFKSLDLDLKGQLACENKLSAIRYHAALKATGKVSSAIIMSPPDTREGNNEVDETELPEVHQWYKDNVTGSPQQYEKRVIEAFSEPGDPDILIVVDKLLTGFDEPKNAVLYIDKPLKAHNLIQAVARINRLHENKQFGLLIDYRGILKALDSAIASYKKLADEDYDHNDLKGLYSSIDTEYKRLPMLNERLHHVFIHVTRGSDLETYRQKLMPKYQSDVDGDEFDSRLPLREDFYQALTAFGLCLKIALSSNAFFADKSIGEQKIADYKQDLQFFTDLRQVTRRDAMEVVDYTLYEKQIRALVGKQVVGNQIRAPQGVYNVTQLGQAVEESDPPEKIRNETDTIRTKIKRTIEQDLGDDPYAQKVFSQRLKEAIEEAEALFDHPFKQYALMDKLDKQVTKNELNDMPDELVKSKHAQAYYGVFKLVLGDQYFAQIPPKEQQKWIDQAFTIEQIVHQAVLENSLNPQNIEAAIRQSLLPPYYLTLGSEKAIELIEQIIQMTRVGIAKKKSQ